MTTESKGNPAKGLAVFALKAAVASVLIGWLVRSGALDFGALAVLGRKPELLAMNLGVAFLGIVVCGLRWGVLLSLAGIRVPVGRLLSLQFVAVFFNVVIPGSVGGDVVKSLYVARDAAPDKRPTILLIVFIERLMGLAGLVAMANLVVLARGPALWSDALLRPTAIAVGLLGVATVLGPIVFVLVMRSAGERIESWTTGTTKLAKLLGQLVSAMRLLASGPKKLAIAFGMSMALHATTMGYFTVLTRVIGPYDVGYQAIATIFPLGLLTIVLPISPSGLGVGHVAFDRLFSAIGLTGGASGATIFNVYLIGQIVPNLFGIVPYLALKRSAPTSAAR